MKRALLKLFGLAALGGCASARGESRSISVDHYNYTDRYIGDVMVNGVWTGGVGAYRGGGSRVQGLMAPRLADKKIVLKVKWIVADTYDIATNKYTRKPDEPREADVDVPTPYPEDSDLLVLHFYPDGHVEAEMTGSRKNRRIPAPDGLRN